LNFNLRKVFGTNLFDEKEGEMMEEKKKKSQ